MAVPSDKWTYVFDPGANLVPSLGPYASAIEQAIILATPNANRGMVIWNASVPQVTGQPTGYPTNWYAFQARCLWIDPDGNARYYNGSVWNHVVARPGVNSISNTMVVNGTLTISKLNSTGGSAGNIIRVAALGGFEFVTPIAAINANELPINRIFSPASGTQLFRSINGVKDWATFDSALIVGALADNVVGVNKLLRGAALQVPMVAADGNSVAWTSVLAGIADNAIPLTKIAKSVGDAGKYLRYAPDGTLTAGVPVTETRSTKEITTLPSQGSSSTITHGLTGVPQIVCGYMVCVTADAGYSVGDVVPIHQITLDFNQTGDIPPDGATAYQFSFDDTSLYLTRTASAANALVVYNKTTGANHTFIPANWKFRFTALLYP